MPYYKNVCHASAANNEWRTFIEYGEFDGAGNLILHAQYYIVASWPTS